MRVQNTAFHRCPSLLLVYPPTICVPPFANLDTKPPRTCFGDDTELRQDRCRDCWYCFFPGARTQQPLVITQSMCKASTHASMHAGPSPIYLSRWAKRSLSSGLRMLGAGGKTLTGPFCILLKSIASSSSCERGPRARLVPLHGLIGTFLAFTFA